MQDILEIEGNSNRPKILFEASTGMLSITGRSIIENAIRFYEPVLEWIKLYCDNPAERTELHIKMEYFNTSTSKYILSIIDEFNNIYTEGQNVEIFWYSADEDMEELGEDYKAMIEVPFNISQYNYK